MTALILALSNLPNESHCVPVFAELGLQISCVMKSLLRLYSRGENVEEAFLDTARKIYQNIQDGRYVCSLQALELHSSYYESKINHTVGKNPGISKCFQVDIVYTSDF